MMTTTGAEGRRWSDLPDLFLDLVARRLSVIDHMRFGLVCKSWRSAATGAPPCPQPPWFLSGRCGRRELLFYSFWEDRTIRFRLRLPLGMIGWEYRAASHGWLFMAGPRGGPGLCLLNPVTRARIDLPPCTDRYSLWDDAALSSDPATATATGDRAVVVMWSFECETLICRIGDKQWTVLRHSPIRSNVAFHKGLPHMIKCRGNLVAYDLDYKKSRIVRRWFNAKWEDWRSYLIEDRRGDDLLQVLVHLELEDTISGCVVLKLVGNKDGSSQRWVRMKNLGGAALFVSTGHSKLVSVDSCATMGMRRDCVYELDDSFLLREMSLKDGSKPAAIRYLRQASASNVPCLSLWFSPSIPSPLNRRKRVEKVEHFLSYKKKKKR